MANTATASTAAAAAAECHYQAGRFSHAAIEIQRCCKEERSDDGVNTINLSRRGGKPEGSPSSSLPCGDNRKDDSTNKREMIILATDDDDDENIDTDDNNDTSPQKTKRPATENDSNILRVELIALSPLAHRADLAMCQFRSSMSNSTKSAADNATAGMTMGGKNNDNHNNTTSSSFDMTNKSINGTSSAQSSSTMDHLWKKAKRTNREYRSALRGAAMSLVNTASALQHSNNAIDWRSNNSQYISIVNAMKSTALAILMAGVSASHLYLYQSDLVDGNQDDNDSINGQGYVKNGNDNNAWNVLVNSAVLAADLMMVRSDFINTYDNVMDNGENDMAKATTSATRSLLEESLIILNDTLFTTANNNAIHKRTNKLENERDVVAIQTFRTALKVAALSCGKVILPTVEGDIDEAKPRSSSQQQPHKKRKKSQEATPAAAAVTNRNIWSVNYTTHFNPMIHSRERIVDALSFHCAATKYSCDEAKLRNKRMICLGEGQVWGDQASSDLFETDGIMTTAGVDEDGCCSGYAWKMKHCLQGLDIVSSSQQLSPSNVEDTIRSLEKMAHSSSSRFACDLLGCFYARRGDIARALEMFQSSLECTPSDDSDEESAQRRTIVNMSLCFLALGEANTPVELLLHLWMATSGSNTAIDARPRPVKMVLTSYSAQVGANKTAQDKSVDHRSKEQLLWMLFYASSLSQDWATCLNCTEEVMKASVSTDREDSHTALSRVFALLQCRRPSTAQELILNVTSTLMTMIHTAHNDCMSRQSAELLLVLTQLYNTDAHLSQERCLGHAGGKDALLDFIQCANKSFLDIVPQVDVNSSLLIELQIMMANNQGVAQVVEGDSVGALGSFRKATQLLNSRVSNDRKGLKHLPWLLIPTFFNLSLLLLRDGHLEESARSWLLARKYLPCWEKAIRGDNGALKKLRGFHTVAINRHVILMAKRKMQREAAVWDQENIMEWVPPSFESAGANEEQPSLVGGVNASQVIALDVILLRYAVSFAEKKAAASFRRSAGSIGY